MLSRWVFSKTLPRPASFVFQFLSSHLFSSHPPQLCLVRKGLWASKCLVHSFPASPTSSATWTLQWSNFWAFWGFLVAVSLTPCFSVSRPKFQLSSVCLISYHFYMCFPASEILSLSAHPVIFVPVELYSLLSFSLCVWGFWKEHRCTVFILPCLCHWFFSICYELIRGIQI